MHAWRIQILPPSISLLAPENPSSSRNPPTPALEPALSRPKSQTPDAPKQTPFREPVPRYSIRELAAAKPLRIATCHAEGEWAELIAQLRDVAHDINGPICVVVVDEVIDEVCREDTIDVESVRERLIVDVEQAMQVDIGPWLP